ncbi:hypothetical protein [Streptomyces sp. NPDC051662]|uniref:hypothetical protein n=1 Tax=Streptomyces sp. NPDC051662 TaxID=3154750 RepID=UPI00343DC473
MTMWIGRPGNLRAFKEAATTFERSPESGTTEFRSLAGGITTWTPQIRPRRLKLAWQNMLPDDLAHLDRLARRVDGPGPVAVVDPASANWLLPSQALGVMGTHGASAWSGNMVSTGGAQNPNAAVSPYTQLSVVLNAPSTTSDLTYNAPGATGYPVMAGMTVSWWAPSLAAIASELRLAWYRTDGSAVPGTSYTVHVDRPIQRAVPAEAAYVRPVVRLKQSITTTMPIGPAVLRLAAPRDSELRIGSRQTLSVTAQQGRAPLNQYRPISGTTVTDIGGVAHITVPGTGTGTAGGLEWKPGDGSSGFPVVPGQLVCFTNSLPGAEFVGFAFYDAAGDYRGTVLETNTAIVPADAVYVVPFAYCGPIPTPTPIGASSLMAWDPAPAIPAGEGGAFYSVTNYGQTVRPGQLHSRDASLELVEVTHANG